MDNSANEGESDDKLGALPDMDRRKNQRSSEDSHVSQQSTASKDLGYTSGDGRSTFAGHSQSSSQEASQYFHGLLGHPRLVARTSKAPFVRIYENQYPREKIVSNVGDHPLCTLYDQQTREAVWKALSSIDWLTIDISRIGFSGRQSEDPIIMLITVKAGSTIWIKAQEAVNACQSIVQRTGCEIEVEMREGGPLTKFVGSMDSGPELVKDPYQRIPEIGQSIGVRDEGAMPRGAGTMTAYLKVVGGSLGNSTYALTCHHVVFPEHSPSPAGDGNTYKYSSGPQQILSQPAKLDHDLRLKILQGQRSDAENELAALLAKQTAAEEGLAEPLTKYEIERIRNVNNTIAESKNREAANNNFSKDFGFVVVSSGVTSNEVHGNIRDWALVELYRDRFNRKPTNIVPEFNFTEMEIYQVQNSLHQKDRARFLEIRQSPITEIIGLDDVLNAPYLDVDGERSFRVLKHGRTTHWTAGVVNEIKSDCQRGRGEISTELCVVNLIQRVEFTRPGDSGSLVIDYYGRAVGVAHGGGALLSEGTDYHYVTPIEWLFEDIKNTITAGKIEFSS